MRKPWQTPYRWLPHTAWHNIRAIASDIFGGVRNVIRWIPVIWFDRDWDYSHLAQVMEYKLRRMSREFREYGHHVGSPVDAKRCRICADLLRRILEDDYFESAEKEFEHTKFAAQHAARVQDNDQRYLGLLIGKYLAHWWD